MNKCFLTDNICNFVKLYKNKQECVKLFYNLAIKYKSYNIITYIVTDLEYLEDYFILKTNTSPEVFEKIKQFLIANERKNFIQKYTVSIGLKLIKKDQFDKFKIIFDELNFTLHNIIVKSMCIYKRINFIKYIFDKIDDDDRVYIIKHFIDHNNDSLWNFFFSKDVFTNGYPTIIEPIGDEYSTHIQVRRINNFIEYALYRENYSLYDKILKNIKVSFEMLENIILYREEDLIQFIKYANTMDMECFYRPDLRYNIIRTLVCCPKYNVEKYIIQILEKCKDKILLSREDVFEKYNFHIDVYQIICRNHVESFDIHDYVIKYLSECQEIDFNIYIQYVYKNYSLNFIKEYITKYKIDLSLSKDSILKVLLDNDYDDEYYLNTFEVKLDKIIFLIDNNIDISDYKNKSNDDCISYLIENMIPYYRILDANGNYIYKVETEEKKKNVNMFIDFIKKYANQIVIKKNHINYAISNGSIKILSELFMYLPDDNNDYSEISCEFLRCNDHIFTFLRQKLNRDAYNSIIEDINTELSKNFSRYFRGGSYDKVKTLIDDGMDVSQISVIHVYNYRCEDDDNIECALKVFDLFIEKGYKHIYDTVKELVDDEDFHYTHITRYLRFLDDEEKHNLFKLACKYKNYPLINHMKKEGHKLSFGLIRKNKLNLSNLQIQDDITGEITCAVCYVNTPSVIFYPCGHLILCSECSIQLNNNCPMDNMSYDKKILVKGDTEEKRFNCNKCRNSKIQYVYSECGHVVCKKCLIKSKCVLCNKKSQYQKIYFS